MAQKYGRFEWTCPVCKKHFEKNTPQGLGLAKENHMRVHYPTSHYHTLEDEKAGENPS
jgi:hypothetical protein